MICRLLEVSSNITKKQKAIDIAANLMFAAMKNNDNVGLFIFTEEIEKYIPARKGKGMFLNYSAH